MNKEKVILFFVIIGIISLVVFSNIKNSSRKNIEFIISFNKNESRFLNDSLVNKLLIQNMQLYKNESNLTIDLKEIEDFLEIQPEILNAEVFLLTNGKLKIEISERKPIIRIQERGFYLDKNGEKIPLSKNYVYKVPIFSNSFKNKNIDQIIYLTKIMSSDSFFKNEFSEMWIEDNKFYIRFRNFDFNILWGTNTKINNKSKNLLAFCAYSQLDSLNPSPKRIDLSIENQIVAIY
tara:strand:- start:2893 stop:3597 length:705 start_codon:yes stop_codon:yes gene_type:complete